MWLASLTLRVYQCESRSLDFTSFQSERWPVLLTCSETAEVWVRTKRISFSCSLLLEGSRVHLSGHNRSSLSWRCPGVLGKIRSNAHRRVLNNTKDRQQRKLEILMCEKLVSVSPTRTTYRERFFVLSRAWDEEKFWVPMRNRTSDLSALRCSTTEPQMTCVLHTRLSNAEVSLLKKGLNFVVTPANILAIEIIDNVESAVRPPNVEQAENVRRAVNDILTALKKKTRSWSLDEGRASVGLDTDAYNVTY